MAELFAVGRRDVQVRELAGIAILKGLPAEELILLARSAVPLAVAEGQVVIREGDPAEAIYLVSAGSFAVFRDAVGQPVHLLARLHAGDYFGELGFFGTGQCAASVRATQPGRLLRIAADPLDAFLERHPDLRERFQASVAARYSQLLASALELGRRREVRIKCSEEVVLALDDGRRTSALLENLSLGGACLAGVPPGWRQDADVAFELGVRGYALPLAGRISWREDDKVGLAFAPLDERHDAMIQMVIRLLLQNRS